MLWLLCIAHLCCNEVQKYYQSTCLACSPYYHDYMIS